MALATHLGSWLLGTVKNTTGTTAGTIRNVGFTQSAQNAAVAYNDTAATRAFVLPAGSIIFGMELYQTTTFTSGSSGTFTVLINGTTSVAATITTGTAGILELAPASDATTAVWANVGTTDAIVTYTGATLSAGVGVLVIKYGVRQSDGTYVPTAQQA
jgi:hypothetical protein